MSQQAVCTLRRIPKTHVAWCVRGLPSACCGTQPFFEALHAAVKPGGIVCTQAESLWLHLDIIKALAGMCSEVFAGGSVSYGFTTIPTYPSGQIGMMLCSKAKADGSAPLDPRVARQPVPGPVPALEVGPLQYYNAGAHAAAFALPQFAVEALGANLTFQRS